MSTKSPKITNSTISPPDTMRKLAFQVPESVGRLLKSTLLRTPPTWYTPVLSNPPPVQPARSSAARHTRLPSGAQVPKYNDVYPHPLDRQAEGRTRTHQMKHLRERKPRVEAVVYEEDRIRRRFFADFPFEALRPTSLVEGREVRIEDEGVRGRAWERLDQRGAYPTAENVIAYTLNLHHTFEQPLSKAYEIAVEQFSVLRARHELATLAAEAEARAYGAQFKMDPFERVHAKEQRALESLATYTTSTSSAARSNKFRKPARWSMAVPSSAQASEEFTAGQSYASRWRLPPPLDVGGVLPEAAASPSLIKEGGQRQVQEQTTYEDEEAFIQQEMARA